MQLNHGIAILVTVLATTIWLHIHFLVRLWPLQLLFESTYRLSIFNPSRLFMPIYIVTLPPSLISILRIQYP